MTKLAEIIAKSFDSAAEQIGDEGCAIRFSIRVRKNTNIYTISQM